MIYNCDQEKMPKYAKRYAKWLIDNLAAHFDKDKKFPVLIDEYGNIIRIRHFVDVSEFKDVIKGNPTLEKVYSIYKELEKSCKNKDYSKIKEKVKEIEEIFDEAVENYLESQKSGIIW